MFQVESQKETKNVEAQGSENWNSSYEMLFSKLEALCHNQPCKEEVLY